MAIPSIYVGETAHSVQERSREHWEGYRRKDNDNHMVKHMTLHHEEGAESETGGGGSEDSQKGVGSQQ